MDNMVTINEEQVSNDLKEIIFKVLNLKYDNSLINESTDLLDLGLASIQMVDLLSDIENKFNIAVDVEDISIELFTQYQNMLSFVLSNLED